MLIEESIAQGIEEGFALEDGEAVPTGMPLNKRAAHRPIANASVFRMNETFLEVCGQFEAQRGMLGFAVCFIPIGVIGFLSYLVCLAIFELIRGFFRTGAPVMWGQTVFFILATSLTLICPLLWVFKKIALRLVRKDYFTTRRTLIRFNRVTRKVYVHHPPNAGGVQTYDWDRAIATLDNPAATSPTPVSEADANKGDGRLILAWIDLEARKMQGFLFVGRAAGNAARGRAWWEYIRRYMEEGPDSVPKPFLRLWKGAWPQMSLLNVFYPYPERLLHGGPLWWLLLPCLAPFDLMRAALHWLAMLLCVEPKFPPEIERAGQAPQANVSTQNT